MRLRNAVLLAVIVSAASAWAQTRIYQTGTVTRMRMERCMAMPPGFLASLTGMAPTSNTEQQCPEYTLVAERVVYVVVGKVSNQLIPLAEEVEFRIVKNELVVRVDDEKRESRFAVKEMSIRQDWERDKEERERIQRAHKSMGDYIR